MKGVVDGGKRYSVGKAKTLRKLILAFGSHKRQFYMDVISSKGCTEVLNFDLQFRDIQGKIGHILAYFAIFWHF